MARSRRRSRPPHPRVEPFPSAREDKLRARLDPDTPQTRSAAYRLGFADNELLLRDELRPVRLQLEFLKPELLQEDHGVFATVAIFGSARIPDPEDAIARLAEMERLAADNPDDVRIGRQEHAARAMVQKARYYDEARRLAQMISRTQLHVAAQGAAEPSDDALPAKSSADALQSCAPPVFVVTGGGPGIMEAANRGAHDIGAESIGLNIVLPFEQAPNAYITPELCFDFHYFALRKMHFLLRAVALVVFPGGFGTFDELFEVLTLIQTRKIRPIPVMLFGREFWERAVNFQVLVDEGVISPADLDIFSFVETAEEAWGLLEPAVAQAMRTCDLPASWH